MAKRVKVVSSRVVDRRQTSVRGNHRAVTFELKLEDGSVVTRVVNMRGNELYTSSAPRYVHVAEEAAAPRRTREPLVEAPAPRKGVKRPDPKFLRAMEVHRRKLQTLASTRSVSKLKRLYDGAQDTLERKLQKTVPGRKDTFTAHQQRIALVQVRQGQMVIAKQMSGELGDLTAEAQADSLRGLSRYIGELDEAYTGTSVPLPIEEASVFAGIIEKRASSMMEAIEGSMARYGASLVQKMEQSMAHSLLTSVSTDEAIEGVREVAGNQFWEAERIVRTEQSYAFNSTHADGIEEVAKLDDEIWSRWVEYVSDDGVPLDDRVGADSIALHGQVTRPGGLFTMPDDPDVSDSLIGQSWYFPPDRPNDRSVLTAWRRDWGGLAWVYDGGSKMYLSR